MHGGGILRQSRTDNSPDKYGDGNVWQTRTDNSPDTHSNGNLGQPEPGQTKVLIPTAMIPYGNSSPYMHEDGILYGHLGQMTFLIHMEMVPYDNLGKITAVIRMAMVPHGNL